MSSNSPSFGGGLAADVKNIVHLCVSRSWSQKLRTHMTGTRLDCGHLACGLTSWRRGLTLLVAEQPGMRAVYDRPVDLYPLFWPRQ